MKKCRQHEEPKSKESAESNLRGRVLPAFAPFPDLNSSLVMMACSCSSVKLEKEFLTATRYLAGRLNRSHLQCTSRVCCNTSPDFRHVATEWRDGLCHLVRSEGLWIDASLRSTIQPRGMRSPAVRMNCGEEIARALHDHFTNFFFEPLPRQTGLVYPKKKMEMTRSQSRPKNRLSRRALVSRKEFARSKDLRSFNPRFSLTTVFVHAERFQHV